MRTRRIGPGRLDEETLWLVWYRGSGTNGSTNWTRLSPSRCGRRPSILDELRHAGRERPTVVAAESAPIGNEPAESVGLFRPSEFHPLDRPRRSAAGWGSKRTGRRSSALTRTLTRGARIVFPPASPEAAGQTKGLPMNTSGSAPASTVRQAIVAPHGFVSHAATSLSAFVAATRARWSAFAYSGQLGPTADREVGRRTGGRI